MVGRDRARIPVLVLVPHSTNGGDLDRNMDGDMDGDGGRRRKRPVVRGRFVEVDKIIQVQEQLRVEEVMARTEDVRGREMGVGGDDGCSDGDEVEVVEVDEDYDGEDEDEAEEYDEKDDEENDGGDKDEAEKYDEKE